MKAIMKSKKASVEGLRVLSFRDSMNKGGTSNVSACIDLSTTSHNLQRQHESMMTEKDVTKTESVNKKIRRNNEAESARIRKVREIRALQDMQEIQTGASLESNLPQVYKSDIGVLDQRYGINVPENGSSLLKDTNLSVAEKEKDVSKDRRLDKTFDNEQSDISLDYILPQRARAKRMKRIGEK